MGEKHEHGTMNTDVHEKTFAATMAWAKWVTIVSIGILIFAAIVNG